MTERMLQSKAGLRCMGFGGGGGEEDRSGKGEFGPGRETESCGQKT